MGRRRERAPGPRPKEKSARSKDSSPRPARRTNDPVLALQQAVGNRAFGQLLARKGSVEPTIKIGKSTIVVAGGNIADWATGGDVPDVLDVTSQKGKHSAELERLSKERTRVPVLTLTVAKQSSSPSGEQLDVGSLAIEIKNARIKGYALDGKTESWHVADFDGVHRTTITRKVGVAG
jgi:hypothetical protein